MYVFGLVVTFLRALFCSRSELLLENLALRQQLAVLQRSTPRPRFRRQDRLFWALLSRSWEAWRHHLVLVRPETVIKWHRQAFRQFWRWKSRTSKGGRPKLHPEVVALIRRMCRENATWGVTRIQSELALLGIEVADSTVANYMRRPRRGPSSQGWFTFLKNHMPETAACDFFTVPTATFRILLCFVVLSHDRRRIMHFNVTTNPTAQWTAQQIVEAFPGDGLVPEYLIRDRDGIYGSYFRQRVRNMGIREVITSRRSPWQNPYAERVIGSMRKECLDHVIILGENHLRRILSSYIEYYNQSRTHLSLGRNAPTPRTAELPSQGRVIAIPQVGGLHHRYRRAA